MDYPILRRVFKRVRENSIGYTLVELLTVLSIILILSTIGIFVYNRAIAYAKGTVCQTNLRALEAAIELYTMETDALPASLGKLKLEHIEKGYAMAMGERGWLKKLSFFFVNLDSSDHAHAQFLTPENLNTYGGSKEVFHCPADTNGGASYGINGNLVGRQWSKIGREELVIADSDHYVFTTTSQLSRRHRHRAFALNKGGIILEFRDEGDDGSTEETSGSDGKNKKDKKDKNKDSSGKKDNNKKEDTGKSVTMICHKPGTKGETTMIVSKSALEAHLAHGDYEGECRGGINKGGHNRRN